MLSPKQIEQTLVKLRRFETALDRLIFEKVDEVSVMKFATPVQHHTVPEQRHFSPCSRGIDGAARERTAGLGANIRFPKTITARPFMFIRKSAALKECCGSTADPLALSAVSIL